MKKSNFELLRIIAMLLVVLVHTNNLSLGELTPYDISANPLESYLRLFCQQLCLVCVNLFVLISGWFQIKPRLKSGISLYFQIAFWGILSFLLVYSICPQKADADPLVFYFGTKYWFIKSYLLLFIISPVLNSFIDNASEKTFRYVLIAFFAIQFFYCVPKYLGEFNNGYSALSFVGLYLLAGYVRKYPNRLSQLGFTTHISLYFITASIVLIIRAFVSPYLMFSQSAYNSPAVIMESLFFFLAFSRLQFENRFVNWLGCSTLSVYLFHSNPNILPYFTSTMKHLYHNTNCYALYAVGISVLLMIVCCCVDKLRILLWSVACRMWSNIVK